jgi:phosphoglycerate dehydrogenase-like enzyme
MAENVTRRQFIGTTAALTAGAVLPLAANAEAAPLTLPATILVNGLPPEAVKEIEAIGPDKVRLVIAPDGASYRKALPEAHALFGSVSPEELAAARNLRWIQYGAAGVEHVLFPELVKSNVILTNAKGCYGPAIAEHVFGLLIGLARQIGNQTKQMREHRWGTTGAPVEISGMTMGIVGFGGIGRETARRARGMGLRVLAADIQPFTPEVTGGLAEAIYLVDNGGLEKMLGQCDVVVCSTPHTKRSEGTFNTARFAAMKDGVYFINVSRGKLVKTDALMDALKSHKVIGAGLDVTDPEPLPPDHPLWDMPNVLITSHLAGQSHGSWPRTQAVFIENVRRFVTGLPLLNVVDKEAGF